MALKKINVLGFVGYYIPGYKGGGPIKTVKNLLEQTSDTVCYQVVTRDRDLGDNKCYRNVNVGAWNKVNNSNVFYVQPNLAGCIQIMKILNLKSDYDVVYLNSFFSIPFSFLPFVVAKILGKNIIVGPRGEFSQGALSFKTTKKKVFIAVYKILKLHKNTIYQASSQLEANDISFILGSDVDIYIAGNIGSKDFALQIPRRDNDILKIVFLSRISPMKNLLVALEILDNVKQSISYDIYGPIEDQEYWAECESVIARLPTHIQVEYKGVLHPNEVVNTLSKYDAFFMPTKGENYGHVIAEALCAGLPILIADTTPWRNLQEQKIGWDLPLNNIVAFSETIDQLALMSSDEQHQMRKNVLKLAKNKFSQRDTIEANIAMFEYAANK